MNEARKLAEIGVSDGYASVTVSMSRDLYNRIVELAGKRKCTFQMVARLALAEHIIAESEKNGKGETK